MRTTRGLADGMDTFAPATHHAERGAPEFITRKDVKGRKAIKGDLVAVRTGESRYDIARVEGFDGQTGCANKVRYVTGADTGKIVNVEAGEISQNPYEQLEQFGEKITGRIVVLKHKARGLVLAKTESGYDLAAIRQVDFDKGKTPVEVEYLTGRDAGKLESLDFANLSRSQAYQVLKQLKTGPEPPKHSAPPNAEVPAPKTNETSDTLQKLSDEILHGNSAEATKEFYYNYLDKAIKIFGQEPTILDVRGEKVVVIGDLHGDVSTFRKITASYPPNEYTYVLMGDFVDRGKNSRELLAALLANKLLRPRAFIMIRGDHESTEAYPRQFYEELEKMPGDEQLLNKVYGELFPKLPVAAVLNQKYFIVHGGIPIDAPELSRLRALDKAAEPSENGEITQMLWNDPLEGRGLGEERGEGVHVFGQDVTSDFLRKNKLSMVIRGHTHRLGGYRQDNGVLTLLTTTAYAGDRQYIARIESGELEIFDVSGAAPVLASRRQA